MEGVKSLDEERRNLRRLYHLDNVTARRVSAAGVPCSANASGCNVVQVVQSAKIPTLFIQALHAFHVNTAQSLTLEATSTALMRGSVFLQYNVAVVLDAPRSMNSNDTDGNCPAGTTKEVCALSGIQTLLSGLTPCGPGSTSSTCKSRSEE